MSGGGDDSDKSYEPTPQKLQKAREKGEVPKSNDLSVVAAYTGLLIALMTAGKYTVEQMGTVFMVLIEQSDQIARLLTDGPSNAPTAGILKGALMPVALLFCLPAAAVLLNLIAQRALIFAPNKLKPKLSRISLVSNAKNKFGRGGLFEFAKSAIKLVIYSTCLALFLKANLTEILSASAAPAKSSILLMMNLLFRFLFIVIAIALVIGVVDFLWQYAEHMRKNRMSRKEIQDETKDAEGDPHVKQHRRQRAQEIATNQMMSDVPGADAVIVNPTHFAVALKWSRTIGSAPVCVAKGVDEVAAAIRTAASEAGVPIHSDPPTARALHATVEIGQEIAEEYYRPVAAAIRFAEAMRKRAKEQIR
ncbi:MULTISPECIES: flagellar biosynthesis protein FlhB [unclassified Ruegeria]|uniref:EscU/YscU/HrcU family type III secretion system export apparatus switch protein n=1 Tax=unclassified Ruegeria TaxID=2625375 RepID=UPI001492D718|nr:MULTISPECIES: flagellar type III secretion system protein FlhB [unclassified Ruegeria]NOD35505.1 flagellar type III secretion system protein FlhB [Ruegeria sp. HKCCD7296]NOE43180.1 flagellar type III secretion system protein FlhB [Ruegeria sp. HKCCD7319]